MSTAVARVLILGAGINGCALARELVLGGQSVTVVDAGDIASGATAYSSRLIHGGLRYLEFGELDLVRESLEERTRLLHLARHHVAPLEISIPVAGRFGGWGAAAARFVGWRSWPATSQPDRGLMLVRAGLAAYDAYARDPALPKHRVERVGQEAAPAVDAEKYSWLCSYYDGQIAFPERFTLALLCDAREVARERGIDFAVYTYHEARLAGRRVSIEPLTDRGPRPDGFEPAAIVNATGAWVDRTLARLGIPSERLIGGTKGSHFFTQSERLLAALGGRGVYAEAADGRPVFVLPLDGGTLVGTTDEPFEGDPREATASDAEIEYLLALVNGVFAGLNLARGDIEFDYCGVRPLPQVTAGMPAAITRRHRLEEHAGTPVPMWSVIGGKLTTCRSLAESVAQAVLTRLGRPWQPLSRERMLPGTEGYPQDAAGRDAAIDELARRFATSRPAAAAAWRLLGTQAVHALAECGEVTELVPDTDLPRGLVRWIIGHEWVTTLDDLVERRLMLLYHRVTRRCLVSLAELLAQAGRPLDPQSAAIATAQRLASKYRKTVHN